MHAWSRNHKGFESSREKRTGRTLGIGVHVCTILCTSQPRARRDYDFTEYFVLVHVLNGSLDRQMARWRSVAGKRPTSQFLSKFETQMSCSV